MYIETAILKEELVKKVITKQINCDEAARQLRVTPRTVQNYCYRFLKGGPEGLKDRRTGNHRKLSLLEKAAIVTYKLDRPQRSARLIRDRLRLGVSEEAVRLILVKHRLSGSGALANSGPTPLTV